MSQQIYQFSKNLSHYFFKKNMPELMTWYVIFRLRFLVNLNETSPGIAANVGDLTR